MIENNHPQCMECSDEGGGLWPCPSCGLVRKCNHRWKVTDDCPYCDLYAARAEAMELRSECADKSLEIYRLRGALETVVNYGAAVGTAQWDICRRALEESM